MKSHIQLKLYAFIGFVFFVSTMCRAQKTEQNSGISKTEISKTETGHQLLLNGQPFYINGAGIDVEKGNIESLSSHGANALRTWSMDKGKEILDRAHTQGLKVMMGIWVSLERHGFDYNDKGAVKRQLKRIKKDVMELKDHPALLLWGIGNELNLQSKNPKVWDAVNDISEMIHKVDPNHLTTTSFAGISKDLVELVNERAPDLDFLSVQLYAPIDRLGELIESSGYQGPLLVTEWGATGYWEVPKTSWGAPIENNSSVKADLYLSRYQNSIVKEPQVMGSFVFFWGQKQERTPTWFGMFMPDGKETESVDAMHYAWNGSWPDNRSPRLGDFTLDRQRALDDIGLKAGVEYSTNVDVSDPDNDKLIYRWEIMRESTSTNTGGDAEYIPPAIKGLFPDGAQNSTTFKAPSQPGAYRLFISIDDGNDHTAHANIPFWVDE